MKQVAAVVMRASARMYLGFYEENKDLNDGCGEHINVRQCTY